MTLCEALDWCRQNRAIVQFLPHITIVVIDGQIDAFLTSQYNGDTLEGTVERAIAGEFKRLNPTDKE